MKIRPLMGGAAKAAKQANTASSGMIITWDEPFVKVREVNAQ